MDPIDDTLATLAAHNAARSNIHVLFDGPPGPEAGRFVECEDDDGRSLNAGRWEEKDGYWHLIIPVGNAAQPPESAEDLK